METRKIAEIFSSVTKNDCHYLETAVVVVSNGKAVISESCHCFDGEHVGCSPVVSADYASRYIKSHGLTKNGHILHCTMDIVHSMVKACNA